MTYARNYKKLGACCFCGADLMGACGARQTAAAPGASALLAIVKKGARECFCGSAVASVRDGWEGGER